MRGPDVTESIRDDGQISLRDRKMENDFSILGCSKPAGKSVIFTSINVIETRSGVFSSVSEAIDGHHSIAAAYTSNFTRPWNSETADGISSSTQWVRISVFKMQ